MPRAQVKQQAEVSTSSWHVSNGGVHEADEASNRLAGERRWLTPTADGSLGGTPGKPQPQNSVLGCGSRQRICLPRTSPASRALGPNHHNTMP